MVLHKSASCAGNTGTVRYLIHSNQQTQTQTQTQTLKRLLALGALLEFAVARANHAGGQRGQLAR